jgi:hypothetical protein
MEDELPDYNPGTYLPDVYAIVDKVNDALKKNKDSEYTSLLKELSKVEVGLPKHVTSKSTIRMIEGRRILIQNRLIGKLRRAG